MGLLDGNPALLLGLIVGAELAIATIVTPKFVIWQIKKRLPELLDELSEDKVLFDKIRQKFMGGIFGLFGGRPPSWGSLAKMAIARGAEKFLESSAENPLGTLLQGGKVTQAVKETVAKT